MGRGLVGHDIGTNATGLRPARQLRDDLGRVATQAYGYGLFACRMVLNERECFIQVFGLLVQVSGTDAKVNPALLAFDV